MYPNWAISKTIEGPSLPYTGTASGDGIFNVDGESWFKQRHLDTENLGESTIPFQQTWMFSSNQVHKLNLPKQSSESVDFLLMGLGENPVMSLLYFGSITKGNWQLIQS